MSDDGAHLPPFESANAEFDRPDPALVFAEPHSHFGDILLVLSRDAGSLFHFAIDYMTKLHS